MRLDYGLRPPCIESDGGRCEAVPAEIMGGTRLTEEMREVSHRGAFLGLFALAVLGTLNTTSGVLVSVR